MLPLFEFVVEVTADLVVDDTVDDEVAGRSLLFTSSRSNSVGCSVSNRCLSPKSATISGHFGKGLLTLYEHIYRTFKAVL